MFYGIFNVDFGATRRVIYHTQAGVWLASTWSGGTWSPPQLISPTVGMRLILRDRRVKNR